MDASLTTDVSNYTTGHVAANQTSGFDRRQRSFNTHSRPSTQPGSMTSSAKPPHPLPSPPPPIPPSRSRSSLTVLARSCHPSRQLARPSHSPTAQPSAFSDRPPTPRLTSGSKRVRVCACCPSYLPPIPLTVGTKPEPSWP